MNKSLFFLLDVSGSMTVHGRDQALLTAMERLEIEVFPNVQPPEDVNLTVRIIAFGGDKATWVTGDEVDGVSYRDFRWSTEKSKLPPFSGATPLGDAISKVVDSLYYKGNVTDINQSAPAIVLISDGGPTDNFEEQFRKALDMKAGEESQGLFRRSLRTTIAVALPQNDPGRIMLQAFGRLSRSLKALGLKTYYDVSDNELDQLGTIIMSLTQGLSETEIDEVWQTDN